MSPSIARASMMIGAGTILSRLTGFLRTIVLVAAIGSTGSRAADAFGAANQLPNNIYAIISTGILTAVIVPQIVKASTQDDGGKAFVSKLFTLGTVVLLGATAVAVVLAPWLVSLYAPGFTPEQLALATAFAFWCLPQILFYGLYALLGETMHARNVYGPYTLTPIVNNVVSIIGFGAFFLLFGLRTDAVRWTPGMVALVGGTATLGIALQALLLLVFWRGVGIGVRPDFRWRGMGLGQIGRLAGWTFLMVVLGQLGGLVQSRVLSTATGSVGIAASQNMWLLYMLPYSIIVISIGTPYFTRLSEHAHAGRLEEVRADIGRSIRTLSVFIVIAAFAMAAAAVPAARIFTNSPATALVTAPLLIAYLVSLIPNTVIFSIQRTYYAYNDTRTPFFFTVVQTAVVMLTAVVAVLWVPVEWRATGVALGQAIAAVVQTVLATWLLHRKIGALGTASWMLAVGRFVVAAIPAAAVGFGVFLLSGGASGWMVSGQLLGAVGTAVIGTVSLVVYVGMLALLRAPELSPALAIARRFLPGRR
ncbi:MAG TPA: murein biosynthesis integral membrane protein MurJ [Microbacterium sp.]|uniref:murein biosynthesis integral membrane protein MurJ n=1 Tax=Microbacterium sp. TaxID=51671 RepID=UPI002B469BD5|nr:murein biosynthesis integral membrane protein MurJ [Microbacterium sp.]HKT56602.1 murein biosynthesis integral membrane protein MurJ [Microbacterium sp.]